MWKNKVKILFVKFEWTGSLIENHPGNIGLLHTSITYDSIKAVQQMIQMQLSVRKVAGQCEL